MYAGHSGKHGQLDSRCSNRSAHNHGCTRSRPGRNNGERRSKLEHNRHTPRERARNMMHALRVLAYLLSAAWLAIRLRF